MLTALHHHHHTSALLATCVQIFTIFQRELNGTQRLRRVMATQARRTSLSLHGLMCLKTLCLAAAAMAESR